MHCTHIVTTSSPKIRKMHGRRSTENGLPFRIISRTAAFTEEVPAL